MMALHTAVHISCIECNMSYKCGRKKGLVAHFILTPVERNVTIKLHLLCRLGGKAMFTLIGVCRK